VLHSYRRIAESDVRSVMGPAAGSRGVTGAEAVRVWLLGRFRVSVGSGTIQDDAWRRRKAAALMKLLALASDHRLHREQAMEMLWPNLGRKAASNNLRQAIHAARKALHPVTGSRYLDSENELLVLCPGGNLWVDMEAFEEAAAAARRERWPAAYRVAIELYAGDLLPEDRYEEWAESRRQELRRTYLALLSELAGIYEERGDHGSVAEALRKTIAEEPAYEEAHANLMRVYALLGDQTEALRQYELLVETLSRKLGTEPNAASRALREEIVTGRFPSQDARRLGHPSQESVDPLRHNLPMPRTSFVGLEREMLEVKRDLAMTQLLTLTGAGGSGKTRLALEVARSLVGIYPDGVWLVELAPLSEGNLVSQAVAGALGVQEQPGRPLTDTLVEALHGKEALLVLDNCEHLVEAVARLVNVLLDNSSKLRILATSRETLELKGEVVRPVPALSQPDPQYPPTAADLEGAESARLFVERATQREPSFTLTMQNVQAVSEICRRLDGIPLAIELAAARVGTLSVKQISERLQDSLRLLTSGGRMTVLRQRTLRGALDWSYDLLSKPERGLFGRLSVFAGGWTLEAAEAVASGESVEENKVLDLLSGLVNKSLVVANTTIEGEVRHRMLEPIRQYAREKLEESGEFEELQRRHATFFLALAEEGEPAFRGPAEGSWLDRLEAEHDNLRAALTWMLAQGGRGLALRLAAALTWFWVDRGHLSEGTNWSKRALVRGSAANESAKASALSGLGYILRAQDDFEGAELCLEEALALHEALRNPERVTETLYHLGWVKLFRGDARHAAALFEESLAAAEESGNQRVSPGVLNGLGWIACDGGNFERAQRLWAEALTMARERRSALGASDALINMGHTELVRGNREHANGLFEEALVLGQEVGNRYIVASGLKSLGIAATLGGDPIRAKALLKESLAIDAKMGSRIDIAEDLEGLAEAATALGEHLRAVQLWGAAATLHEAAAVSWTPKERLLHEPLLSAARSRLDVAVWETAFAEGKSMRMEQAIEYALGEKEDAPSALATLAPERPATSAQPVSLTRREQEIAVLVARGLTNRQIASKLSISEHTAATHVRRILKKLGLQSRSQIGSWLAEQRP
jgi:predicted ATPase/DNA-binding SARP family transcriptional activator/DNA-binding CsgD family transcriptional regulator